MKDEGGSLLRSNYGLTDNEGMLLALVVRAEPITAYKIAKVYEPALRVRRDSPKPYVSFPPKAAISGISASLLTPNADFVSPFDNAGCLPSAY